MLGTMPSPESPVEELVAALLAWITWNSDLDPSGVPPPVVRELDRVELTAELYRDATALLPASGVDERVLALYSWKDDPNGVIHILDARLTDGLQPGEPPYENPVFRERLLHELVHHVQYHTGAYRRFTCPSEGEREAYLLGGRYLRQRYATDPLPNRRVLAHLYSRC